MPKLHKRKTIKKSTNSKKSKASRKYKCSNRKNMKGGATGSIDMAIYKRQQLNDEEYNKIKTYIYYCFQYADKYINIGEKIIDYINTYILPLVESDSNIFKYNIEEFAEHKKFYNSIISILELKKIENNPKLLIEEINQIKYNNIQLRYGEMDICSVINIGTSTTSLLDNLIKLIHNIIDKYNFDLSENIIKQYSSTAKNNSSKLNNSSNRNNKSLQDILGDINLNESNVTEYIENSDKLSENYKTIDDIIESCIDFIITVKKMDINLDDMPNFVIESVKKNNEDFPKQMDDNYKEFKKILNNIIFDFTNLKIKLHKPYDNMTKKELTVLKNVYEEVKKEKLEANNYGYSNSYKDILKSIELILQTKPVSNNNAPHVILQTKPVSNNNVPNSMIQMSEIGNINNR